VPHVQTTIVKFAIKDGYLMVEAAYLVVHLIPMLMQVFALALVAVDGILQLLVYQS